MIVYKLEVISREPAKKKYPHPILFVHGAYVGAWCWNEHFMPYFVKSGYSVHALSLRGHGNSGGGMFHNHRLNDYVKDLASVIDELDSPPILIGHSMGCMVIQKYLQNNSNVKAAMFLAPIPFQGVGPSSLEISMRDPMVMLQVHLVQLFGSSFATREFARKVLFSDDISDALLNKYRHLFQPESFNGILDVTMLDLPRPKSVCNVPKIFFGAKDDGLFSNKSTSDSAEQYGSHVQFVDDVAHMMMLDPRWNRVADRAIEWIQKL